MRMGKMGASAIRLLHLFIRDDRGQATVEYILILSMAVFGAGALARAIMGAVNQGVLRLGGALEKDLKTGRMPVSIWNN
ncbi:MAG: hypothetical protein A2428_03330 [Bdellovibrionales bacterium RIFOXYC1_FULL_54_43]|nr:MAG: hypothetical protein A2428_03330 [Bdellovibrionales bacterium RIFOXYC1_FULL_54_43]